MLLNVLVICAAACIGALLRWGFALWLNPGSPIPLGTLAVNWIGGYLIGIAIAYFQSRPDLDPAWRLMVITGFLGTLTTFSAFSADVVGMIQAQRYLLASITVTLHVGGSLLLTLAGHKSAMVWLIK